MAYKVPTFNILCNIWHGLAPGTVPTGPPDIANQTCQLRAPGHSIGEIPGVANREQDFWMPGWALLVPKLTDVRDEFSGTFPDVVECPAGSGRLYLAKHVDDVGKGFANEYRTAYLMKMAFPNPIP